MKEASTLAALPGSLTLWHCRKPRQPAASKQAYVSTGEGMGGLRAPARHQGRHTCPEVRAWEACAPPARHQGRHACPDARAPTMSLMARADLADWARAFRVSFFILACSREVSE